MVFISQEHEGDRENASLMFFHRNKSFCWVNIDMLWMLAFIMPSEILLSKAILTAI